MTFEEIAAYMKERETAQYSRDNYDHFLKKVGFDFPIKSVHITGTNGKGSTANYLASIYQEAGLKVGRYTSPFLSQITENVAVNGICISENDYVSLVEEFKKVFEKYELTSFEMQTFLAFTYLNRANVDLAIIEVGMGGFIDATNIITPVLSIITSVSLEHTAYLGRSISEIAANKAGIIKENKPVLIGKMDDTAVFAIKERAKYLDSDLIVVDDYHNEKIVDGNLHFDYYPYQDLVLSTSALYQAKNASLAVEATKILKDIIPVSEDAIRFGLKAKTMNCRFEYVKPNLILDGGHNPEAIESLVKTIQMCEPRRIHVLFAAFRDKNLDPMLISLQQISDDITLTTFDHKRARTEEEYFLYLGDYKFQANFMDALNELENQYPDDVVLVTGSLAFVGLVREKLNV